METKYAIEQYEAPEKAPGLADYVARFLGACAQLWISLKYQFHQLTHGAGIVKLMIIFLSGFLILKGTGIWKSQSTYFDTGNNSAILGFSLSPAEPNTLRDIAVKNYVERYGKIAIEERNRYGIPASISMAQGIIESRCGESTLAEKNNNHFGIKCFSRNCAKGHCSNFTDDSHKDFFRKYNSDWESWREHSKLLSQERYKPLKNCGNDYNKWAKGLSQLGYATDDTYAEKLITVIERYHLDDLDD
jgi:hypothetical protein